MKVNVAYLQKSEKLIYFRFSNLPSVKDLDGIRWQRPILVKQHQRCDMIC